MANQIPIKVMCDGSGNTCGLAQFTSSDSVAIAAGGTGLTSQGICEFVQPGLYAVGCKVTYLGICAGKADTGVGHDNTYVGYAAGTAVTTGCQHTLIGKDAGSALQLVVKQYLLDITPVKVKHLVWKIHMLVMLLEVQLLQRIIILP